MVAKHRPEWEWETPKGHNFRPLIPYFMDFTLNPLGSLSKDIRKPFMTLVGKDEEHLLIFMIYTQNLLQDKSLLCTTPTRLT